MESTDTGDSCDLDVELAEADGMELETAEQAAEAVLHLSGQQRH